MIRVSTFALPVLTALAVVPAFYSLGAELKPDELYSKVSPSVITLDVQNAAGRHFVGNAFLAIGEGLAVTAWHVVHDAKEVEARFSDNRRVKVLGIVDKNEKLDLAVLALPSFSRPRITLASEPPRIGSRVYLVGSPRGLDFTISEGLIGQIRTLEGVRYYQLSCPISAGDSGGPVFNDHGEAVGVVSWRKADAENVGFAIPSADVGRLNSTLAVAPWSKATIAGGPGLFSDVSAKPKVRAPILSAGETTNGFCAFQKFLGERAGQHVTVVVQDAGKESRFNFQVPQEAAK